MLKAFCRVAPSVLLSLFAICDALVFLRAIVFSSRSSLEVHARRFLFLFAIRPPFPFKKRQLVSLMRAKEKPSVTITFGVRFARARTDCGNRNIHSGITNKSSFRSLALAPPGGKRFLFNKCSRNYQFKSDYDSSIEMAATHITGLLTVNLAMAAR